MAAAPPIATATLRTIRPAERNTRNGEPVARPMARARIGPMSGATSIAPMMTAALPTTRPSVAIPIETPSCNQYEVDSLAFRASMPATRPERASTLEPRRCRRRSWAVLSRRKARKIQARRSRAALPFGRSRSGGARRSSSVCLLSGVKSSVAPLP